MNKIQDFNIPNFNDEDHINLSFNPDLIHNDEKDYSTLKKEKKRKRKFKRVIRVLVLLLLVGIYFLTPFSNVKEIQVSDTVFINKSEIIELSKITKNSKFLLINNLFKPKLNHEMIESYEIRNDYNGVIRLEVKEKKAIGYIVNAESIDVISENGKLISFSNLEDYILNLPKVNSNDESFLKSLSNEMIKFTPQIISRISEVDVLHLSYEKNTVVFHMEDGNKVYGSMKDLHLIENYNNILESVNEKNQCIQLDESTNSAFKFKCP